MKTKRKNTMFRQGDVWIERVKEFPAGLNKQTPIGGRVILAYGEVTGHHHSVDADAADWWKVDGDTDQFITVKLATELLHQEHSPIPLAPGNYRVRRQREYSPEAIRNVAD